MAELVECPKVSGETCRLFDLFCLVVDVHSFSAATTRKDVGTVGLGMRLEKFPGPIIQGDFLIQPSFGVSYMDETPLKIYIFPF